MLRTRAILVCLWACLALGCTSMAPEVGGIQATVESSPEGVPVTFHGKTVGETPVELRLRDLDEAMEVQPRDPKFPVVERRIRVLGPDRIQLLLRVGEEPTALAKKLGLSRVVVFEYGDRATFDIDQFDLRSDLKPLLRRQAELLNESFAGLDVHVCGHTDATGTADHNAALSVRRARSVADFLIAEGVTESRLHVQGFGADFPAALNDSPQGRSLNRRTEIVLPN